MTNKEKIKYLSQYQKLIIEYKYSCSAYNELDYKLTFPAVKTQQFSLISQKNCNVGNPIEAEYFRLLSLKKIVNDTFTRMKNIENSINALDDALQRTVLRLRYIDGTAWDKICLAIHYEWAWTHRIHSNALQKIKLIR